jgi:hypothetical protein
VLGSVPLMTGLPASGSGTPSAVCGAPLRIGAPPAITAARCDFKTVEGTTVPPEPGTYTGAPSASDAGVMPPCCWAYWVSMRASVASASWPYWPMMRRSC